MPTPQSTLSSRFPRPPEQTVPLPVQARHRTDVTAAPTTYRRRKRPAPRPVHAYTDEDRAADAAMRSPEAAMDFIRRHYLAQCHPALRAYLSAPAYGLLYADAHSSVHPDLIGPIVTTRAEAVALAADAQSRGVRPVVMAGVTINRRAQLEIEGFYLHEDDLMAPGTRIFIDRYGRTPKAILRAHRYQGQPLEPDLPAAPAGAL